MLTERVKLFTGIRFQILIASCLVVSFPTSVSPRDVPMVLQAYLLTLSCSFLRYPSFFFSLPLRPIQAQLDSRTPTSIQVVKYVKLSRCSPYFLFPPRLSICQLTYEAFFLLLCAIFWSLSKMTAEQTNLKIRTTKAKHDMHFDRAA